MYEYKIDKSKPTWGCSLDRISTGIRVPRFCYSELALDRNATLIANIKNIKFNIKILVIGDESNDKTRILDYGADEFALKPLSPENASDKILMPLARDKVAENRSRWVHYGKYEELQLALNKIIKCYVNLQMLRSVQ